MIRAPLLANRLGVSTLACVLFALPTMAAAQDGSITGRVIDAETGQPLANAQLQVLGTSTEGVSDPEGAFILPANTGTHSISVMLIGYRTLRVDGIEVAAGAGTNLEIELSSHAILLNPVTVTVSRGREERTVAAPAQVSVVQAEEVEETIALTASDFLRGLAGVDHVQTGLLDANVVARGFNSAFSTNLLVLTDHRYARVPSLRVNRSSLIAPTALDIERVELLLGPAAALYGPNAANGVNHIITSSPIDRPGTKISLAAGERSVGQGAFRHAIKFSDKAGLKVSGRYMQGHDFEYVDPVEVAAAAVSDNPLIGARKPDVSNYSGDLRFDLRPWDDPDDEIVFSAGYANTSLISLTGLGSAQVDHWSYRNAHLRLSRGGLFAQAFFNQSNAGDTYLLRTGNPIVDDSNTRGVQLQYGLGVSGIEFILGADYAHTRPATGGTIHGEFEDMDNTTEYGGYLHGKLALSGSLDLVGVARMDRHEHIEEDIFTPRAALVYEPAFGQSFRFSYGSGFETPTSTDFFLDVASGSIPLGGGIGYTVRAGGVPMSGYTWSNRCAGGVGDHCMYSPFAPGQQLPASGAVLWDNVLLPLALTDQSLQAVIRLLGLTPELFAQIIGNPQPGEIGSTLLRLNTDNPEVPFFPDPGVSDVVPLKPVVTETYELGYNGIVGDRMLLSISGYRSSFDRTYGSLSVVTPSVFLDGASVAQFLAGRLVAAGVPGLVAQGIAEQIAGFAATVPLGTVAPDQRSDHDILLSYPTYGDDIDGGTSWYGLDLGFQLLASEHVTLTGSYSHTSEDCYDVDGDGQCPGIADVALNAAKNKFSFGARWADRVSGWYAGGRMRYTDSFPVSSGVYNGTIDSYSVLDLSLGMRVPGYKGFLVGLTVNNALNNLHQEFIGAPEIGRLALVKVQYEF